MGYVKDSDVKAVTGKAEIEGDEEELPEGWDNIIEVL